MKNKFVLILKKIPWYHIIMFFVCAGGYYHFASEGSVIWDDNAYAVGFVVSCTWIVWDLVITLSLDFFDKKRSHRFGASIRQSSDQEVTGNG